MLHLDSLMSKRRRKDSLSNIGVGGGNFSDLALWKKYTHNCESVPICVSAKGERITVQKIKRKGWMHQNSTVYDFPNFLD
jgi:hypothetical protein